MRVTQILNRFYVHDLDRAVKFYGSILNEKCTLKFKYAEMNLKLAQE